MTGKPKREKSLERDRRAMIDSARQQVTDAEQRGDPIPETIGPYRILGVLAKGGMGIVYHAEQETLSRFVALKTIRPEKVSPHTLRRFEHEAAVLARLQHPGIAKIYEAGVTEENAQSQPFFAMEFIRGHPLTRFAERRKLSTRARLRLLVKIGEAIQYAHQQGIIHRDIKPGNILVEDSGRPRVVDFGVAAVTDSDMQITTLHTRVGQILGTVPYMSPEQIRGNPNETDTRSDVYALAVVGYELLSGRLPYDVRHKPMIEASRIICEEEPTPLSSVSHVFRGDIELIFAKALEKSKDNRYQSCSELITDIDHHLNNEMIDARAPSTWAQAIETPSIFEVRRSAQYHEVRTLWRQVRLQMKQESREPDPDIKARLLENCRRLAAFTGLHCGQFRDITTVALALDEFDLARSIVSDWTRRYADDLEPLRLRMRVEFEAGAYGPALEAADTFLEREPGDEQALKYRERSIQLIGSVGTPEVAVPIDIYLEAHEEDRGLQS